VIERCVDCGAEYETAPLPRWTAAICPCCQARADAAYRVAAASLVELPPWRWSRHAMQERLVVTWNRDE